MSVQESLWSLRLPNGDVRSGTIEQLEEAFRAGHIDGNSPVLPPGAREWVKLDAIAGRGRPVSVRPPAVAPVVSPTATATVRPSAVPPPTASQPPAPAMASHDMWQVRLANGEVRSGTRQQLDEAFQAGHLDGGALALPAGALEWTRLDSVLALRDSAAPPPRTSSSKPPAMVTSQQTPATPPAQRPEAAGAPQTVPVTAAHPLPAPAEDGQDICHVKIPRVQLEDAFRAGFLDESILVLTAEASDWVKLGSLVERAVPSGPTKQSSISQTGEWPPAEPGEPGVLAGGISPPAPETEPALEASAEEPPSQRMENENGLAGATSADDETPSMPRLA